MDMTIRPLRVRAALLFALIGAASTFAACSDETGTTSTTTGTPTGSASNASSAGSGGSGVGGSEEGGGGAGQGGDGGSASPGATFIKEFDATKGELPEGLAVVGTTAYVGFAPLGKVIKVSLPDGGVTAYGGIATFPAMGGTMLGLAFDKAGALFVGVSSDPAVFQPGIYKIPVNGGNAFLFAQDPGLTFPNGLVFDANGDLFVTDSVAGAIYKIAANGLTKSKWKEDPLLVGDMASPCKSGLPVPLGANGLALSKGVFYVTNTDKASIIKIPVNADGTPGAAAVFAAPDCTTMAGLDGVMVDDDGTLIAAANSKNTILRVAADGKPTVITSGGKLNFPASVAVATIQSERQLIITNAAFAGMPQMPGLLSYPLPK